MPGSILGGIFTWTMPPTHGKITWKIQKSTDTHTHNCFENYPESDLKFMFWAFGRKFCKVISNLVKNLTHCLLHYTYLRFFWSYRSLKLFISKTPLKQGRHNILRLCLTSGVVCSLVRLSPKHNLVFWGFDDNLSFNIITRKYIRRILGGHFAQTTSNQIWDCIDFCAHS